MFAVTIRQGVARILADVVCCNVFGHDKLLHTFERRKSLPTLGYLVVNMVRLRQIRDTETGFLSLVRQIPVARRKILEIARILVNLARLSAHHGRLAGI